jgi:uncharacterized membrane protein
MKARIRVAKHALHPMLVVFPLGLLATSVAWDICRLATHNPSWGVVGFWTIVAGVIGGLLAAVPGFIDWLAIPNDTRAKSVGTIHMILNLVVVGLFVVSLIARSQASGGYAFAGFGHMVWGWLGVGIALASAWLGGELVETLGISVHEGANANAPSSLREDDRGSVHGSRVRVHREA